MRPVATTVDTCHTTHRHTTHNATCGHHCRHMSDTCHTHTQTHTDTQTHNQSLWIKNSPHTLFISKLILKKEKLDFPSKCVDKKKIHFHKKIFSSINSQFELNEKLQNIHKLLIILSGHFASTEFHLTTIVIVL